MAAIRPTPFDLVFGSLAEERFPALDSGLAAAHAPARNRDAFLMVREVVQLVHDLRPEEGVGSEVGELAALLHHAFLFWQAGTPTLALSPAEFESVLRAPPGDSPGEPPPEFYIQFPEGRRCRGRGARTGGWVLPRHRVRWFGHGARGAWPPA
jgi:hypothetical protein